MKFTRINVGYLLSYDYELVFYSIAQLYEDVDHIILAIDKDNLTWTGNNFSIPNSFFQRIKELDTSHKIEIYKDTFYLTDLTPMQCEIRERNMLLARMGKGWNIQLDVDEYILDFKTLKNYLKKYSLLLLFPSLTPIYFQGTLITLYKKTNEGFLFINDQLKLPYITNQINNVGSRRNYNVYNHLIGNIIVHQSWARELEEIITKVKNWGHVHDFDTEKYIEFWRHVDEGNFKTINDFHPVSPKAWDKLHYSTGNTIPLLMKNLRLELQDTFIKLDALNYTKFVIKHNLNSFSKPLIRLIKLMLNYDNNPWLISKYRRFRNVN